MQFTDSELRVIYTAIATHIVILGNHLDDLDEYHRKSLDVGKTLYAKIEDFLYPDQPF